MARSRRSAARAGALLVLLPVLLLATGAPATAEVVALEIERRGPVAGGRAWGLAGPYEKLAGTVRYAVDPDDPANARIVDLDLAPRGEDGRVHFRGDFYVLKPVTPEKGNGALFLEVPNRGGKAIVRYFDRGAARTFDPTAAEDFGDGFLLERGFTLAWVGWQWDVPPERDELLKLEPVRVEADRPIEGLARADHVFPEPATILPLGHRGHTAYPVADRDDPRNVLTVRDERLGERRTIPRKAWRFVQTGTAIEYPAGFEPGKIYEAVWVAREPVVVGLGLAAVRDFVSHLRYSPESPAPVSRALGMGISQTGRFLRQYLWQGFNLDEAGRPAFDGLLVHTAGAGRGSFNHRFGQPSRDAHPFSAFFYPTDVFPFTGRVQSDPVTGRRDGLLETLRKGDAVPRYSAPEIRSRTEGAEAPSWQGARPRHSGDYVAGSATQPGRMIRRPNATVFPERSTKVFFTNTGYEYWGRAASLIHTTVEGASDLPPLPSVRIYHLAGAQHFVDRFPPERSGTRYPANPADFLWSLRALLVALDAWVADGVEPPPSRYPEVDPEEDEPTLVAPAKLPFPAIPFDGGTVTAPRRSHEAYRMDYGPRFWDEGVVTQQPPEVGEAFPVRVPRVGPDGNPLGGLLLPEVAVPLATYTPWNLRSAEIGAPDELADFRGAFLPLPVTAEERKATGDPRLSVEEHYGGRDAYLGRYAAHAARLARERYLLDEDLPELLERAEALWELVVGDELPADD